MAGEWRVAWITGASTGIGREMALRLARSGVAVAASARNAEALRALAGEQAGIAAYPVDVTDEPAMMRAVAAIEAETGPIDLAILNAGLGAPLNPQRFDTATVRKLVETNYMGVVHGLAAVLPRMIERGRGHIALNASIAGYRGMARMGAYAPTKAALISLAECLRAELDRYGIRVSLINPGYVDTPLNRESRAPLPFLITADIAADRILAGLRREKFEIAFPSQTLWLGKTLRVLPYPVYFWLLRNVLQRRRASRSQ
ncbi:MULTISPECIES: SDR family NAD(P)-dependent oxidoreductase [Rhodomicrobium]|uniref:SDR family NAD(P)-dependent oxidoreductase n=1 Tax=Rhodomicrobium TaxID=1068 RepID=UPI000B4B0794|nr:MULTISPECIES: SDR family NAD(P)-dependent oxidoreductase [Rhodomicrobium]